MKRNVGKSRRSGAAAAAFDDASFASNLAERHYSTTFKLANGHKYAMYCA
ncbi:MAG: hypothetical protein ABSD29_24525 [Verrucomicrobiota bacterium]|jgi:hypothetical protein